MFNMASLLLLRLHVYLTRNTLSCVNPVPLQNKTISAPAVLPLSALTRCPHVPGSADGPGNAQMTGTLPPGIYTASCGRQAGNQKALQVLWQANLHAHYPSPGPCTWHIPHEDFIILSFLCT